MEHLRQVIRNILLTEAAKSQIDMPIGSVIKISHIPGDAVQFTYAFEYEDNPGWYNPLDRYDPRGKGLHGRMIITRDVSHNDSGKCGGAMKVAISNVADGWGPLLYDVAIEYATIHANGLIADRGSVSAEARNVWDYYLNHRDDVKHHQLDNMRDELTPGAEEDNCEQDVAGEYSWRGPDYWKTSPLSKRYTKQPDTMNALQAAGQLIIEPKRTSRSKKKRSR